MSGRDDQGGVRLLALDGVSSKRELDDDVVDGEETMSEDEDDGPVGTSGISAGGFGFLENKRFAPFVDFGDLGLGVVGVFFWPFFSRVLDFDRDLDLNVLKRPDVLVFEFEPLPFPSSSASSSTILSTIVGARSRKRILGPLPLSTGDAAGVSPNMYCFTRLPSLRPPS